MDRPALKFRWTSRLSTILGLVVLLGLWTLDFASPQFHDWSRQIEIDFIGMPLRRPGRLVPATLALAIALLAGAIGFATDLAIYRAQTAEWERE